MTFHICPVVEVLTEIKSCRYFLKVNVWSPEKFTSFMIKIIMKIQCTTWFKIFLICEKIVES